MALIKTTEELQKYLKVNISQKASSIIPYVNDAQEEFLKKHLGEEFMGLLDEWYDSLPEGEPYGNAAYTALLPYVQNALAKFTYFIAAPSLDLIITESGFAVVSTQQLAPASEKRVKAFMESMERMGWKCVETMLVFLEKNKADYPEWVEGEGYTVATGLYINTASEFDKYVDFAVTCLKFQQYRKAMENVELLNVIPSISKELSDAIKQEIIDGEISDANELILPLIKRAIANYTAFDSEMGDKYKKLGDQYITEIRKIMDATPDDYPEYRDSDLYDDELTDYSTYENTQAKTTYVTGGLM